MCVSHMGMGMEKKAKPSGTFPSSPLQTQGMGSVLHDKCSAGDRTCSRQKQDGAIRGRCGQHTFTMMLQPI